VKCDTSLAVQRLNVTFVETKGGGANGCDTSAGDVPIDLMSLMVHVEEKHRTQVWCQIAIWDRSFSEDDHAIPIHICKFTTCTQIDINNLVQIVNGRTFNMFSPMVNTISAHSV
jgi:hypothetical protein